MDLGEKLTILENEIYDTAVSLLQREGIPSTVGRIVMDGVYRRFVESAYYVALQRAELLEKEIENLSKEEEQGEESEEVSDDNT